MLNGTFPPLVRADSADPHPNPIRRFREELRLSREEFAEHTGINISTLRNLEAVGRYRSFPSEETLARLVSLAKRNRYPLNREIIFERAPQPVHKVKSGGRRVA